VSPINTLRWSEGLLQVGDRAALRATQEPQRVAAAALDAVSTSDAWSAHRCARFSPMRKVWLQLH